MASQEPALEAETPLPYVEGHSGEDIVARIMASHVTPAPKDDAMDDLNATEEAAKLNHRIVSGYSELRSKFSEVTEVNWSVYQNTFERIDHIWKVYLRDQDMFMKNKRRGLYLEALCYWLTVMRKDVSLMMKFKTKPFAKQLRSIVNNSEVQKVCTFPSTRDILLMYGESWIGSLTEKEALRVHLLGLFKDRSAAKMLKDVEARDLAAGLLWSILLPISLCMDGIRVTQTQLKELTGSKPSTFGVLANRILNK